MAQPSLLAVSQFVLLLGAIARMLTFSGVEPQAHLSATRTIAEPAA
ncbi:MAG TPA: hypothetical protein VNV43_13300 [Candidatus Acidoferrales bacterium]|jgi:hypothetical protein|nr:hypothetical protein [Candidatus Acidoferrales bacterium]